MTRATGKAASTRRKLPGSRKAGKGTTALHRSKDPSTSREAAAFVRARLPNLENVTYVCLKRSKARGRIVDELVDATGLDKVTVSPRLRPLVNKGLIVESKERRMGKSGRYQTVWKCVEWATVKAA